MKAIIYTYLYFFFLEKLSYFSLIIILLWLGEEALSALFLEMLFVQNSNFKGLCVLSSEPLEMHRNQSFSLNDEGIKDIGVLRHELDLYPNFYLIKSLLCVSLLTPFNILDPELKPQVKAVRRWIFPALVHMYFGGIFVSRLFTWTLL